ncbi:Hsp20/alpha crystallin family protein [Pseudodesulfovibrio sediminis]|uniref:SHSP domain-containing protein n=1 Tax=Pseudodesulfovibrio sediminis TaxID=2810563 RepID=A0ABM7P2S4_9BACT|nr:Hsp20/alpha crystallin family protein [Pseudodesulfovibrio sediminis]BCS87088.1 hypothetical protein PSDVSF_03300 [Pseudodesulfovibrio sediminis]
MDKLKKWRRAEISRIRGDMDRLFDDLCSDFDLPLMTCRITGDLDLQQKDDILVVKLELGTINPEDVQVSVLDRRLIISAVVVDNGSAQSRMHQFRKEIRLPCIIRTDEVQANFKDGVLEVHLPKCPKQSGQKVEISRK